jgi:hypothetical protein
MNSLRMWPGAVWLPLALAVVLQDGSCRQQAPAPVVPAAKSTQVRSTPAAEGGARQGVKMLAKGTWGGRHVGVSVNEGGAEFEFDCAHGTVDGPIELDADGRFDVAGSFVHEGGPASVPVGGGGQSQKSLTARYRGRVQGDRMTLSVTVAQTGGGIDALTLTRGQPPSLEKCY